MTTRRTWLRRTLMAAVSIAVIASVGLAVRSATAAVGGGGEFKNFGHGLCLDANINRAGDQFIPVKTFACHGRANQTWVIDSLFGTGHKRIRNLIDPNRLMCLEPFGFNAQDKGPVRLAACNSSSTAQQWDFVQSSNQPDGLVSVRNVYGTDLLCQTQNACGSLSGYFLALDGTTLRGSGSSRQAQAFMRQIIADFPATSEQWFVPHT